MSQLYQFPILAKIKEYVITLCKYKSSNPERSALMASTLLMFKAIHLHAFCKGTKELRRLRCRF